jgi:lipopolysaccharide transport system ATP-binding protein
MDNAIEAENISKVYRIGVKQRRHDNFLYSFMDFIKSPLRNYRKYRALYRFDDLDAMSEDKSANSAKDIIWALKNVSFEVKKGERLGLIGRNGAGKSTLLKILSRVTNPTCGRARICGRISSLLEVGTGFHPELTGRENIYLNGTVLGMQKTEIDSKYDQIIDFSGVEKFIDTPVKRYSSGMRVRLAFSVAAHLEPEILIVDEVLAVGDAEFQKKCLNKMEDTGQSGRTVIFVSHNMEAVTRLCERTLLLEEGRIIEDGPSGKIVSKYLCSELGTTAAREWKDPNAAPKGRVARLISARVLDERNEIKEVVDIRSPVMIEMTYEVTEGGHVLLPDYVLKNDKSEIIFITVDQDPEWRGRVRPKGFYSSKVEIPGNLLAEGLVIIDCQLLTLNPDTEVFIATRAVSFTVVDNMDGDSARGDYAKDIPGIVRPKLAWTTEYSKNPPNSAGYIEKQTVR